MDHQGWGTGLLCLFQLCFPALRASLCPRPRALATAARAPARLLHGGPATCQQHRAGERLQFLQLKVSRALPSFPHATSQTLLAKFKQQHEDNRYFVGTPVMEPAFIIQHFAGKVKYQIKVSSCLLPLSTRLCSTQGTQRGPLAALELPSLRRLLRPSSLLLLLGEVPGRSDPVSNPWLCFRGPYGQEPPLCRGDGPRSPPSPSRADPRASADTSKGPPTTLLTHPPHARTSERRTWTTCGQTLWPSCGAVTAPTCGSSSAWTPWLCSAGRCSGPPSRPWPCSGRLGACGPRELKRLQVGGSLCRCREGGAQSPLQSVKFHHI